MCQPPQAPHLFFRKSAAAGMDLDIIFRYTVCTASPTRLSVGGETLAAERNVAMALVLLVAVALLLAAVVAASMPKVQEQPVRVRIDDTPRRSRRR